MKKYKELKEVLKVGEQIKASIDEHYEKIQDSSCDKHAIGFNKDGRFSSAKITLSVDSYRGYYGNSGCSQNTIVMDSELFSEFFIKVLNRRFKEIMFETADDIIKYANTKKAEAITELEDALKTLKDEE